MSEEALISSCSNSSSLVGLATIGTASASIVVVSPGGGGGGGPGPATKMNEERKSNILIPTLDSSGGEEKELEEEKCDKKW